jgi:hypothetical protein
MTSQKWTRGVSLGLCLLWLGFAQAKVVRAQSGGDTTQSAGHLRLLRASEGRAIVNAALEQNESPNGAQDCSHLVHQIYLDAGFEYPYASSFELYAGSANFERVKHAQPGDLIAWPGHVGIVLKPSEHSFYSLVSTGLEAQKYDGPYWRSRGRPRFYRYKKEASGVVTAAKAPGATQGHNSAKQEDSEAVAEERSARSEVGPDRPPEVAKSIGYDLPRLATPTASSPMSDVVRSIVIVQGNKQPTKAEVAQGISELSNASGNVLRSDAPSKLTVPVVIFERLQVERVEIRRDHGWAQLQVDSRATIVGGETDYTRRREHVRWELHRSASGWEATAPTDRTYVPQDVAVRNLAAQLARVTEAEGPPEHREAVLGQELELAKLLSGLLGNK